MNEGASDKSTRTEHDTLGPIEVEIEGQIYETQPIEVTVVRRGLGPESGPEMEPFRDPELEEGFIL